MKQMTNKYANYVCSMDEDIYINQICKAARIVQLASAEYSSLFCFDK
jgi:hypothetical protein